MAVQGREYWLAHMEQWVPGDWDDEDDVQCCYDQFVYCGHQAGLSDDEVQALWDAYEEEDDSHYC